MSYGREKIYSDTEYITAENVVEEVHEALKVHEINRLEIESLWNEYRGKTKIEQKTKEIRPEINHKVVENRAYEITKFHLGYVFGEPIQYVRRENPTSKVEDDVIAGDINALNGYMTDAGKSACDNKLAKWIYVAGVGYRLTSPNKKWVADGDEPPFKVRSLDPRKTFIVYRNSIDEEPLMAVCYTRLKSGDIRYSVYTENSFYEFTEGRQGVVTKGNPLGMIPIVEYISEEARLGVFEIVVSQLHALNELQSNRMDDIVQFVNSFLAVLGGELDAETYKKLEEWKTLCLPEGADAKYLSATLSQADVQTFKEDIVQAIFEICAVPNRTGGESASDNGVAVLLRNGYTASEARAKETEEVFKVSEFETLKIVLRIMRDTVGTKLRLSDIIPHFTRRNYENIATKAQVLVALLNSPKVHPEVAYAACGMFPDPESAYLQGMAYYEEQMKKWEPIAVNENDSEDEDEDDVQVS